METRRPARIFIVDDSRVIQMMLADMFSEIPSVEIVGTAETEDEAIAGILEKRPDCVLLDMQLKRGDGVSVLQAVRPKAPDIVFLVMTNNEGEKYRRACMAAGACHFLDKTNEFNKIRYVIDGLDLGRK
ncbi:MAG: response regulator transcription factor [Burkholderiales bacterium]|nr:response regulator transcription factor [Burkholderiales bacterium]